MERTGNIYLISNDINDKLYIGQTVNSIYKRFLKHYSEGKRGKSNELGIDYNMAKFGIEHFKVSLIEVVPLSYLDERERYWIEYYQSHKKGYNLTTGGQKCCQSSKLTNQECLELIEDYQNRVPLRDICEKYQISANVIYNTLENFSQSTHRPSSDLKKESCRNNFAKATLSRQVSIYNKELNRIYSSKKEALLDMIDKGYSKAKDWHNIRSPLDKALNNSKNTCFGFHWEYCQKE